MTPSEYAPVDAALSGCLTSCFGVPEDMCSQSFRDFDRLLFRLRSPEQLPRLVGEVHGPSRGMRGEIFAIVVVVGHRELESWFIGPADLGMQIGGVLGAVHVCLLYTSDAADDLLCVD